MRAEDHMRILLDYRREMDKAGESTVSDLQLLEEANKVYWNLVFDPEAVTYQNGAVGALLARLAHRLNEKCLDEIRRDGT